MKERMEDPNKKDKSMKRPETVKWAKYLKLLLAIYSTLLLFNMKTFFNLVL